jgi:hypothetical protein
VVGRHAAGGTLRMPVFKPDGVGMLLDDDGGGRDGWFTPLLSCKTVLLPRQARDKHRESTQNKDALS